MRNFLARILVMMFVLSAALMAGETHTQGDTMTASVSAPTTVVELAIYKLKAESVDGFAGVQPQIVAALKQMPGFVSFKSTTSVEDPTVKIDYVEWESAEQAKHAAEQVMQKEEFKPLMAAIENVIYFGHFKAF